MIERARTRLNVRFSLHTELFSSLFFVLPSAIPCTFISRSTSSFTNPFLSAPSNHSFFRSPLRVFRPLANRFLRIHFFIVSFPFRSPRRCLNRGGVAAVVVFAIVDVDLRRSFGSLDQLRIARALPTEQRTANRNDSH